MSNRATMVFVVAILTALVAGCPMSTGPRYREIARFDCGKGRSLVIKAECEWEVLRGLVYEVHIRGTSVVPTTGFLAIDPMDEVKGRLEIVRAVDGDLVCIVDKDADFGKRVVIMHSFVTNDSWPYVEPTDVSYSEGAIAKMNDLYREALAENPDLPPLGSAVLSLPKNSSGGNEADRRERGERERGHP